MKTEPSSLKTGVERFELSVSRQILDYQNLGGRGIIGGSDVTLDELKSM